MLAMLSSSQSDPAVGEKHNRNVVPFLIELPQETSIRAHASLAVILLLIASWAFWNED